MRTEDGRSFEFDGRWAGTYFYPSQGEPVPFVATLTLADDGALRGAIREPNSFSEALVPCLDSEVDGHVDARGVVGFEKRYNGRGGVSHAVRYDGMFVRDAGAVLGGWMIDGASGPFALHVDRAAGELLLIAPRYETRRVDGRWRGLLFASGAPGPVPLELRIVQEGASLRGDVVAPVAAAFTGARQGGQVRLEVQAAAGTLRASAWLAPDGRTLGGGVFQGDALTGTWIALRS